jgi:murein DD-endopeptidase MepM/ murein hydrolase activator NlpD
VKGPILSEFGSKPGGLYNDGINIASEQGTPVRAAENGVVVYAGNELKGYGNLILVRHADGWLTAYAHLDRMDVDRGKQVSKGQAIGTVGRTGNVQTPQLHFGIRRNEKAIDPRDYLDGAGS